MKPQRKQAKRYLMQISSLTKEIQRRQNEIEALYNPVKGVSFDTIPGNGDTDATLHLIQRIERLREKQDKRIAELIERRAEIFETVSAIRHPRAKEAIYLRYCTMLPVQQIATRLYYSEDWVNHLLMIGLEEVADIKQFKTKIM